LGENGDPVGPFCIDVTTWFLSMSHICSSALPCTIEDAEGLFFGILAGIIHEGRNQKLAVTASKVLVRHFWHVFPSAKVC
jgi:hypothetical protein